MIETVLSRDVFQLAPVTKPILFLQQYAGVSAGDHHLAGVEIGDVGIAG
jgi:hypothetical protein